MIKWVRKYPDAGVISVTGDIVSNTDPLNPVVTMGIGFLKLHLQQTGTTAPTLIGYKKTDLVPFNPATQLSYSYQVVGIYRIVFPDNYFSAVGISNAFFVGGNSNKIKIHAFAANTLEITTYSDILQTTFANDIIQYDQPLLLQFYTL